ncbi:MAG: N-acetyl-gamma-glutamyl-phosphate reductase [Spirochaetaceae bacterium]|nr:MAG: N-acetyl-gamma-glutamyl-phosphate reductase [Spirochaetaceae bacterium]
MRKYRIFVDGQEGTTGIEIAERLAIHPAVEVISIDPEKRKDPAERRKLLNASDLSFLCLPDDAARESVSLVTNKETCIIDASTAHRVNPDWVFGLPELISSQRAAIAASKRVSVPGCHSSAFILPLAPLVAEGIVPADYPVCAQSITGYSGAGKKMIAQYTQKGPDRELLDCPRPYALTLQHKHLPEMKTYAGLVNPPLFMPVICNYYKGLAVSIPFFVRELPKKTSAQEVHAFLERTYKDEQFVRVMPFGGSDTEGALQNGFFEIQACNNTNRADIFVFGNADQILIITRLDNLGKGASGAAVQCMNIMLGLPEDTGLA